MIKYEIRQQLSAYPFAVYRYGEKVGVFNTLDEAKASIANSEAAERFADEQESPHA